MCADKYLQHTVRVGDCLEWTRCFNTDGYPRAGNKHTTNLKVHREVFFLVNGYYPEVVRHKCDNLRCINPEHLIGGTPADNEEDRKIRGRIPGQVFEEEKEQVITLRKAGYSYKQIAAETNIGPRRVEYILTRWRKES